MCDPLTPRREAIGRVADRFAAIELTGGRDVEFGSPVGEFLLGYGPGLVRSVSQTLVDALPAGVISK